MNNDIDNIIFENQINLSEIGKYDKFIDFGKPKEEHSHFNGLYYFTINHLKKDKFDQGECRISMINMDSYLCKKIEEELKEDIKLQNKIFEINRKAKERIEKLEKKPRLKLQKKYGYKNFFKYYTKMKVRQGNEEASSSASCSTESCP